MNAFQIDKTHQYVRRIQFVHTPKQRRRLDVAECDLSCLTNQCLFDHRIAEIATLQSEITAWAERTNTQQRAVDWQFAIKKARIKLKRL